MILADQFPFLLHNASFSTSAVFLRSLPLWCRGAVAKRGGPSVSREVGKNPCKAQAWLLLNLPNPLHTKWERCPPRGMLAGRATKALACSERPARSHPAPLDVEPQRGQRGRARSRGKGERVRATESEVSREGEGPRGPGGKGALERQRRWSRVAEVGSADSGEDGKAPETPQCHPTPTPGLASPSNSNCCKPCAC